MSKVGAEIFLLALLAVLVAAGCGIEEARDAGEQAAGNRNDQEAQEASREPSAEQQQQDSPKPDAAEPALTAEPQPTVEPEIATSIRDLRICGVEDYDDDEQQCTVDRSEEEVQSNEFYCTALVDAEPGNTVAVAWEYEEEEVYTLDLPIGGSGTDLPLHSFVTLGPQDNPAGSYRCVIEAGDEEASITLQSGGPEGRVVNAAVCQAEDLVEVGEATEVCAEDAGGEGFDEPEELACSATYTDVLGENLRFEMFYDGTAIPAIEYTAHMEAESPSAVISGNLPVTGERITLEPGPLPPGDYSCRFRVGGEDGELLKELPFEVRGSGI